MNAASGAGAVGGDLGMGAEEAKLVKKTLRSSQRKLAAKRKIRGGAEWQQYLPDHNLVTCEQVEKRYGKESVADCKQKLKKLYARIKRARTKTADPTLKADLARTIAQQEMDLETIKQQAQENAKKNTLT